MLKGMRGTLGGTSAHVRTVVRNFLPAFLSRGVVQISAYVDTLIATLLPSGAVAALSYAQNLYVLPVSLFGMSVSAAELPADVGSIRCVVQPCKSATRTCAHASRPGCGRSRSS